MPDKEAFAVLAKELSELLREKLNPSSFTDEAPAPENGDLPLEVSFVRIGLWTRDLSPIDHMWPLCVEHAIQWSKAPILAYRQAGEWCFRVPLYCFDAEYENQLGEHQWHALEYSAVVGAESLSLILEQYQDERAAREGWMDALTAAIAQGDSGRVS